MHTHSHTHLRILSAKFQIKLTGYTSSSSLLYISELCAQFRSRSPRISLFFFISSFCVFLLFLFLLLFLSRFCLYTHFIVLFCFGLALFGLGTLIWNLFNNWIFILKMCRKKSLHSVHSGKFSIRSILVYNRTKISWAITHYSIFSCGWNSFCARFCFCFRLFLLLLSFIFIWGQYERIVNTIQTKNAKRIPLAKQKFS